MNDSKGKIGFYGCPKKEVTGEIRRRFPECEWVDLDIDYGKPDSGIIPRAYCKIIRNIIDNALSLKENLRIIVASVGADKCEGGRYASYILQKMGFDVVESKNDDILSCQNPEKVDVPISTSSIPLVEKVEKIMDTVLIDSTETFRQVKPTHGFWGVPPNDFDLLRLFPDATHVYGWTRTVEASRPADIDLECFVVPDIPTVFYTQSFCAKSQLAKHLADKFGGLYIDADGKIGMGIKARIEAFLELNI
jgi:hypothetical protein